MLEIMTTVCLLKGQTLPGQILTTYMLFPVFRHNPSDPSSSSLSPGAVGPSVMNHGVRSYVPAFQEITTDNDDTYKEIL